VKRSPRAKTEPLWKEEVSFRAADERYVNRRQFVKFAVLTSLGMFAGNLWILARSLIRGEPVDVEQTVAGAADLAIGEARVFEYPTPSDSCLLIRLGRDEFVAYSQKCTHLSCAVYYEASSERIVCPCHHGYFSARTGEVLQGPPPRPLVRIRLARRDGELVAIGVGEERDA
jgi:Rieske Fe-S protein